MPVKEGVPIDGRRNQAALLLPLFHRGHELRVDEPLDHRVLDPGPHVGHDPVVLRVHTVVHRDLNVASPDLQFRQHKAKEGVALDIDSS